MDHHNQQQTSLPHSSAHEFTFALWPSTLARVLSLPFTRLTSSTLNHHTRVFTGDDFGGPAPLLEEYVYARSFVVLDVVWNLAFVAVAVFVLLTSLRERPPTPLRLWVAGYALLCLLHLGFLWISFQTTLFYDHLDGHSGFMKRLESFSTVISSVWWLMGFYWTVMGGLELLQDSPRLYWLSVVYLAFDLFFMIFCIGMACFVFLAVFCCFPILATVAYAMTMDGGASEDDIKTLPKYKFHHPSTLPKQEAAFVLPIPGLHLSSEDSECCICLHAYEDGVELCTLPCNHHFHYRCIRKWLRINATCPLCKCNMFHGETLV